MWMRYVIRAIILIAVTAGALYLWKADKQKSDASQEATDLATMVSVNWDPSADGASQLYKTLANFHRKKQEGKDVWTILSNGFTNPDNPVRSRGTSQITRTLKENFARAELCGAFDRESNVVAMESGRPPLILKGPYFTPSHDTYLTVAHIVSPIFAPESANALPNLTLVPEPIAHLRVEEVDDFVLRSASELKSMGALNTDSYDLLSRLRRKQKTEE